MYTDGGDEVMIIDEVGGGRDSRFKRGSTFAIDENEMKTVSKRGSTV